MLDHDLPGIFRARRGQSRLQRRRDNAGSIRPATGKEPMPILSDGQDFSFVHGRLRIICDLALRCR
jgi:hypothetical protein